MNIKVRIFFLLAYFICLTVLGFELTGSLEFMTGSFWFTSGFLLLLLLSFIDQPFFSKDANVFVNGVTGLVSLQVVPASNRGEMWLLFLAICLFLMVSSAILMLLRQKERMREPRWMLPLSKFIQIIGRPDCLFSAFLLWGVADAFGVQATRSATLFLFWAVIVITQLPSINKAIADALFSRRSMEAETHFGVVKSFTSPSVGTARVAYDASTSLVGRRVQLLRPKSEAVLGEAEILSDQSFPGERIVKIAITTGTKWRSVAETEGIMPLLRLMDSDSDGGASVGTVGSGSTIEKVITTVNSDSDLEEGHLLSVVLREGEVAYYQITAAQVKEEKMDAINSYNQIEVLASQLGKWTEQDKRFEPVAWTAPPGAPLRHVISTTDSNIVIPKDCVKVGVIPNSSFVIHVNLEDAITHNMAVIGVTGSGKTYLALELINAMYRSNKKILILDVTRQHYLFLAHLQPKALRSAGEVAAWLDDPSCPIGIHQFAAGGTLPSVTHQFVESAFNHIRDTVTLEVGRNEKARLCIVMEEAHSLIPEWNQADQGDSPHVNTTARVILQGRKYGIGTLVITQRTASVVKTVLNQCNTMFALQSFDQTGLDFLKNYMGNDYCTAITNLAPRHAILVGKASSSARPVLLRIDEYQPATILAPSMNPSESEVSVNIAVTEEALLTSPSASIAAGETNLPSLQDSGS
jgi:uncharacterized protein